MSCAQQLVYDIPLAIEQDQMVFHGAQQVVGVTADEAQGHMELPDRQAG